MAEGISLTLKKGKQSYDMTELVESVKWSGRKGAAARTLQVTCIDDDGYNHDRTGIKLMQGHQVIFKYDGKEKFRGLIMEATQSNKKTMTFTAYDNGIYLANNRDTFMYSNVTADAVFRDVCARFGLKTKTVAGCAYVIPELTKPRTTAFDVICDALAADFEATGTRHYVMSEKGKLSLIKRKENVQQWVLEPGANLINYSYNRSIEDIKTRLTIRSKEGDTLVTQQKNSLEKKIGIFQEVETKSDPLTEAQAKSIIDNFLKKLSKPERTLSVEALGIPSVISGIAVYVVIPHLNLNKTFYVDSDTHTFKDNMHTMSLKLNYMKE